MDGHPAALSSPLSPPSSPSSPGPSLPIGCNHYFQAMQPFSASLASSTHNPQPPIRELRNHLLAQEQLLSNCFLIVCIAGELGTTLAPVMEPSSSCPGWPNPPSPPFADPWPWQFRFFQNVPSLSFSLLSDVKLIPLPRKKGRSWSFISPTHATSSSSSHTPGVM